MFITLIFNLNFFRIVVTNQETFASYQHYKNVMGEKIHMRTFKQKLLYLNVIMKWRNKKIDKFIDINIYPYFSFEFSKLFNWGYSYEHDRGIYEQNINLLLFENDTLNLLFWNAIWLLKNVFLSILSLKFIVCRLYFFNY